MNGENDSIPEGTPVAPPPSAASTPASDSAVSELKTRLAGAQAAIQERALALKAAEAEKQQLATELANERSARQMVHDEAQSAKRQADEFQAKLVGLQAQLDRTRLIATEYPYLMSLEADGLLPSDTDVAVLRDKLTKFASYVDKTKGEGAGKALNGMTPPQRDGEPPASVQELNTKLRAAAMANDRETYNRLATQLEAMNH